MILQLGSMNVLEAARVTAAFMVFCVSLWGFIHARKGEFIISHSSRPRVTFRRRIQMGGFMTIALLLGWQSVYVSVTPDLVPMSNVTLMGNVTLIAALAVLFSLSLVHVVGWAREGRVLWAPISPDAEERVTLAIELGRELGHMSVAALTGIALTLETALMSPTITPDMRRDMQRALENVHVLAEQIRMIHANIKSLDDEDTK